MEECNERRDYIPKRVFVGSVSGGLAGRGCVRKRPPAHTEATRARVLCAETTSSAHGRVLNEGVVCVEMLFCTREASGKERWVRRRPPAHTGGVILKVQ